MKRLLVSFLFVMGVVGTISVCPVFAAEDRQFVQSDDYFIAENEYSGDSYIYVSIAKLQQAPTKETKDEGKFLQVPDGKEIWTKYYWKTRIAAEADLKIGTIVIMAEVSGDESIYRAPENKDEARTTRWFMAKIVDVSDLYKGFVTVSDGYKVSKDAMRVIVKETPAVTGQ